jgi:hypothetical protein
MRRWSKLGASFAAFSLIATGFAGVASARGDPTFPCVVVNADTCTVTIPLTSNMNEEVGSTMPDNKPWFENVDAGQGPYGITGPGNPDTTWDGVPGALQGSVWTAILTTGAGEPAGSQAVLTFAHVTSSTTTTGPARPYSSLYETFPYRVAVGALAKITAVVSPVPARGHLELVRKSGSHWVSVGTFTYSARSKRWTITFTWRFPKHATETFRLLATAAPGLSATYGGNFKVATLP